MIAALGAFVLARRREDRPAMPDGICLEGDFALPAHAVEFTQQFQARERLRLQPDELGAEVGDRIGGPGEEAFNVPLGLLAMWLCNRALKLLHLCHHRAPEALKRRKFCQRHRQARYTREQ